MKLHEVTTPVTSNLGGESRKFTIAVNRKAFRTLVDGLYSDKIGSIVRELASNAYDSHQRRGNPKTQFVVKLPNRMNSTFAVRDFGCSMTHSEVMDLYSTLFESSKTLSNNEVGAFGLGAKSFLAYTDACTLTCWLDGEVRSYAINLDEDGIPTVTLVHRAASTEEQGTEVTFAVAQSDFRAFHDAMTHCMLGFVVAPKVLSDTPIEAPKPAFAGNGWRLFERSEIQGNYVRQGCAVYRTQYEIESPHPYHFVIDVPIGEATVTASRESLALTSSEKHNLAIRVRDARAELSRQIESIYNGLSTQLERAQFAFKNNGLMSPSKPTHVTLTFEIPGHDYGHSTNRFDVQNLPSVRIIVDDGTKILRRKLRLKAYTRLRNIRVYILPTDKAVDVQNYTGGVTTYGPYTSKNIDYVKRELGLRDDQIIKIEDLPDVYVAPKTRGGAPRKVIDSKIPWAIVYRDQATAGTYSWSRKSGNILNNGYVKAAVGLDNSKILYLTQNEYDRAIKSGKIVDSNRVDLVVARTLAPVASKLEQSLLWQMLTSHLRDRQVRDLVASRIGITGTALVADAVQAAFRHVHRAEYSKIESRVQSTFTTKVVNRYPLLFAHEIGTVTQYVDLMDSATV